MNNQNKNMPEPHRVWAEMIRQEVENNGQSGMLIPDFLMKIIVTGPGNK